MTDLLTYYRTTFQNIDYKDDKFIFDLLLNKDGRPVEKMTYFGSHGGFKSCVSEQGIYPVILQHNGEIDYGSLSESGERYGETNLLTKIITENEYATISYCDDSHQHEMTFKITRLHNLNSPIK